MQNQNPQPSREEHVHTTLVTGEQVESHSYEEAHRDNLPLDDDTQSRDDSSEPFK